MPAMGRRPNQVILQYFERGPKLADNSNRYPQTCKLCGETFPKGRIDSLTTHLTKRCPAISEADRINACLSLNGITGITGTSTRVPRNCGQIQSNGQSMDLPLMQQGNWTALETLAEVSRQIDLNEKHDDRGQAQVQGQRPNTADGPGFGTPLPHGNERFELQEQFTLDNPPSSYSNGQFRDHHGDSASSPAPDKEMTTEEQMETFLQSPTSGANAPNLSVAAAATARLNTSLLDPQLLLGQDLARALQTLPSATTAEAPTPDPDPVPVQSPVPPVSVASPLAATRAAVNAAASLPTASPSTPQQPWGEITYMTTPALHPAPSQMQHVPGPVSSARSVFRVDRNGPHQNGAKARHSRARFDTERRKEVQEVRKVGACIRCRILRKTCSVGSPCDTCRKVLSPRIWRSGCVRTKFTDQLDIYSAGVQIVQAQKIVNHMKSSMHLNTTGLTVEVCLFPESTNRVITAEVLQGTEIKDPDGDTKVENGGQWESPQVVMLDNDKEDIPGKVESYMREMIPEFIRRETSHFMCVTLRNAFQICQERNDELLKKALELWCLVEMIDRELTWTITLHPTASESARSIGPDTDRSAYHTICLQLTAAAERKAGATSKILLTGMQRLLQDSKTKIDHAMFFTTLILLNCVEKSTWAFKAWEQDSLRVNWPLAKPPSSFTQQGYVIADLLRMLLGIRRALPKAVARESDGILLVEDQDPVLQTYFRDLNLTVADIQAKQQQPSFSPTDSRSFDLLFCSTLLLPSQESSNQE